MIHQSNFIILYFIQVIITILIIIILIFYFLFLYYSIFIEYFNFLIAYSTISCSLITRLIIDFELKSNAAEIKLAIVDIRIPI